ncbi:MAG TPA: DUF4440 domain-containing protein [Gemmatimonadaceae bacterium]|jgi:uncharacterized protein (TIGR02246 family)|nr:DUF4440 domain-containing protein [Gemmatimonadaceae bacterium]
MSRSRIVALSLMLVPAVCATAAAQEIPPAARTTIEKANADWLAAMKRSDAVATAEPYADDAVFVTSTGESVRGRPAIEKLMRDRFASGGHAIGGSIKQDGITAVGNLIYEWGHASLQLARDGAKPTDFKGRYVTVWAADSAGRWRIIRNLSLP